MQTYKIVWMPMDIPPVEAGSYLITTCKDKIRIDRWDGSEWGLCRPRYERNNRDKGRYRPHKAWSYLPPAYDDKERENESMDKTRNTQNDGF